MPSDSNLEDAPDDPALARERERYAGFFETRRLDTYVAERESARDVQRFLSISNAGALLIIFGLTGAFVQAEKSITGFLPAAFFFSLGLCLVGILVFNSREFRELDFKKVNEEAREMVEIDGADSKPFKITLSALIKRIRFIELLSFSCFNLGIFSGFLALYLA